MGYFRFARRENLIPSEQGHHVDKFLKAHDRAVKEDLAHLETELDGLRRRRGVEVFALDEEILERSLNWKVYLEPFDRAILAAVLVRAERLRAQDAAADLLF